MNKMDIATGVIIMLIGMAVATLGFILIQVHTPAKQKIEGCNDGWSYETIDGKIVETYIPVNDTCKKGN